MENSESRSRASGFADVFDAVATLLVRQPEQEVITMGLQQYTNNEAVGLAIASSLPIPTSTVEHAHTIWNHMQEIGEINHKLPRRSSTAPSGVSEFYRPSTDLIITLDQTFRSLTAKLYAFSMPGIFSYLQNPTTVSLFVEHVDRCDVDEDLKAFAPFLDRTSDLLSGSHLEEFQDAEGLDSLAEIVPQLCIYARHLVRSRHVHYPLSSLSFPHYSKSSFLARSSPAYSSFSR